MRIAAWALAAAAIVAVPRVAVAAGEDELVSLINARRAETRGCDGAREAAAGPLAPSARWRASTPRRRRAISARR